MAWSENFKLIFISFAILFYMLSYSMIFNVQKCLVKFSDEDRKNMASGVLGYACYFTMYLITTIIAPYTTNKLGPRVAMFSACVLQLLSNVMVIFNKWMVYSGKAIHGCSFALMYVAQGRYLSENATKVTLIRNLGIYFSVTNLYMFIANGYVYYRYDKEVFDKEDLKEFYILTSCLCVVAIGLIIVPRKSSNNKPVKRSFAETFIVVYNFFIKKEGWKFTVLFLYIGLEHTFFTIIYGNALSLTLYFNWHPLRMFAVSGLLTGVGSTFGAVIFAIYGKQFASKKKFIFILIGLSINLIAILCACLNLPNAALQKSTNEKAMIKSDSFLALFCSFLFGMGDVFFIIEIYGLLAEEYNDCITEAHAVFRFIQSIASGLEHYYAKYLGLYGTLCVIIVFGVVATIHFYFIGPKKQHRTQNIDMNETEV